MNNPVTIFKNTINSLPKRQSLLFHACCGICCVYPLLLLDKYFAITIYYTNANIYPDSEYDHRLSELERYLKIIKKHDINLVVPQRNMPSFLKKLSPHSKEKEGGKRCKICYDMRLEEAFKYASENHFDYCGTVMSVSNRKNATLINKIGLELEQKYKNTKFLVADFKKENGITINDALNKMVNLYHQNYCGCPFSMYFLKKIKNKGD